MSLLMEALRKAEAAKTKQDGTSTDQDSDLSLEPLETAAPSPAQSDSEETPPPSQQDGNSSDENEEDVEQFDFADADSGLTLELEPTDPEPETVADESSEQDDYFFSPIEESSETSEDQGKDDDLLSEDELQNYFATKQNEKNSAPSSEGQHIGDYETLEAAAELSQYERSKTRHDEYSPPVNQAVLDRQTANSLFQAKKNSQQSRRQQIALLAILLALIPLGGGFYWYYSTTVASSDMFPGIAQNTAPQGPLEEAANTQEPAVIEANEFTPAETLEDNAPDTATAANTTTDEAPDIEATPNVEAQPAPQAELASLEQNTGSAENTQTTIEQPASAGPEIRLTRTSTQAVVNPDLVAAYESYQQNDLSQAQRLYTQVLSTQPNNRDALLGLALINRQQGNVPQAQAMYSRLLQLNPRDPLARAGLLESGQSMRPSRQEAELKGLLEDYPGVAPLAFALGNLYATQSRWNEAQNAYFDALLIATEVDPDNISPDYAFNLAVSLERLNQLDLAYNYYQQAMVLSTAAPTGFSMESLNQRLAYLQGVLE